MRAQILVVLVVLVMACGRSAQQPPAPSPRSPGGGSAIADATIATDPERSFYCFRDLSDPSAVQTLCWRSRATCDRFSRQVGPDKPPRCMPVPSVYCYTSTDETGAATTCTPVKADCDKLRTIEADHNRHDPKLTACAEQH